METDGDSNGFTELSTIDGLKSAKRWIIGSHRRKILFATDHVVQMLVENLRNPSITTEHCYEICVILSSLSRDSSLLASRLVSTGCMETMVLGPLFADHLKTVELSLRCLSTLMEVDRSHSRYLLDAVRKCNMERPATSGSQVNSFVARLLFLCDLGAHSVVDGVGQGGSNGTGSSGANGPVAWRIHALALELFNHCCVDQDLLEVTICTEVISEVFAVLEHSSVYSEPVLLGALKCLRAICHQNENASVVVVTSQFPFVDDSAGSTESKGIVPFVVELCSRASSAQLALHAAACLVSMRRAIDEQRDYIIGEFVLPVLIKLCKSDQFNQIRIAAADQLAYLLQSDPTMEKIARWTDHSLLTLNAMVQSGIALAGKSWCNKKADSSDRSGFRPGSSIGEPTENGVHRDERPAKLISSDPEASAEFLTPDDKRLLMANGLRRSAFQALACFASSDEAIRKDVVEMPDLMGSLLKVVGEQKNWGWADIARGSPCAGVGVTVADVPTPMEEGQEEEDNESHGPTIFAQTKSREAVEDTTSPIGRWSVVGDPCTVFVEPRNVQASRLRVLTAALSCLHSLSRSVRQLRTSFQDHEVYKGVHSLLVSLLRPISENGCCCDQCSSIHSQPLLDAVSLSSALLCNLVLEFAPPKTQLMDAGIIPLMISMTKHPNSQLRLNGIWGLMNIAYQANDRVKNEIFTQIGMDQLFRLLQDSDRQILLKTLGLIRNLLTERSHIDALIRSHGRDIVQVILLMLDDYQTIQVKEQTLCIMGNMADGDEACSFLVGRAELVGKIVEYLNDSEHRLQLAALTCINNLVLSSYDDAEETAMTVNDGLSGGSENSESLATTAADEISAEHLNERRAILSSAGVVEALKSLRRIAFDYEFRQRVEQTLKVFGFGEGGDV